ncbi:serine/threonine-protein kinase [Vigna angularis]|nr:serine/threonine-protein kinase [Vigna angularis]
MDVTRKHREQSLVAWARPYLSDRRKVTQIVDPLLERNYPLRCLQNAIAITAMCLQEQPNLRPPISDIVVALEYLASESVSEVSRHRQRSASPPRQSLSPSDTQTDPH